MCLECVSLLSGTPTDVRYPQLISLENQDEVEVLGFCPMLAPGSTHSLECSWPLVDWVNYTMILLNRHVFRFSGGAGAVQWGSVIDDLMGPGKSPLFCL